MQKGSEMKFFVFLIFNSVNPPNLSTILCVLQVAQSLMVISVPDSLEGWPEYQISKMEPKPSGFRILDICASIKITTIAYKQVLC